MLTTVHGTIDSIKDGQPNAGLAQWDEPYEQRGVGLFESGALCCIPSPLSLFLLYCLYWIKVKKI